jgi:hypothetical protein
MKWLKKILNNNITIIAILIIVLLVAFYFNPNFGLGMREIIEPLQNSSVTYYGPDGSHANVSRDSSGNVTIIIIDSNGNRNVYTRNSRTDTIYIGPDGGKAEVITDNNGKKTVVVTYPDGKKVVYYNDNVNYNYRNNSYDNYNHYTGGFENVTFYGPNGGKAQVVKTPDENTIVITYKNGVTDIYYIDNDNNGTSETYRGPNGNTAKIITDSNGNKSVEIKLSNGNKIYYKSGNVYTYNNDTGNINHYDTYEPYNNLMSSSSYTGPRGNTATTYTGPEGNSATSINNNDYYNSLPEGIYRHQIPKGEEDKYILKSQVVPPVCPKCPDVQCSDSFDETKCPACPACERCPEPSFTCEKVPNYNAFNPKTMPLPVLTDFSSFGM